MLKLGVIGTNIITDQMLDAAKTTGKYELTAVYSRTLEHAEKFGKPYGATEFYDDIDKFFEEGDFDVVYIASPNSLHYQQARKAIENDKYDPTLQLAFSMASALDTTVDELFINDGVRK